MTATEILAEFFVDAKVPIEMGVSFDSTFVVIGETTGTGSTLEIFWVVKRLDKIGTGSTLAQMQERGGYFCRDAVVSSRSEFLRFTESEFMESGRVNTMDVDVEAGALSNPAARNDCNRSPP